MGGLAVKLSEAIKKGCLETEPGYGFLLGPIEDGRLRACVLGATYIGLDGTWADWQGRCDYVGFLGPFIEERTGVDIFPARADFNEDSILNKVTEMNDILKMPREEIADYLRSRGY